MAKYEYKKEEKMIYPTGKKHVITKLPPQRFITIEGKGNPNEEEFSAKIQPLYQLSYAIKMAPKKGIDYPGSFDYAIYPLEGFWGGAEPKEGEALDKSALEYKIMLKQPGFVTEEVFSDALSRIREKIAPHLIEQLKFETIEEGLVAQMVHRGSFDDEPETFAKLDAIIEENGFRRKTFIHQEYVHKEVYLNDFRKTAVENLKTILRVAVEK